VEIYASLTNRSTNPYYVHYYICNLDRRDCKDQIEELDSYEIKTMIGRDINKYIVQTEKAINTCLALGHKIIIHVDESDFGTGYKQALSNFLPKYFDKKNIGFIFYSATNEEVLFSNLKEKGVEVTFIPSENYKGYDYFLDNNLLYNATQFFENDLTLSNQAKEICIEHAQSIKQIGVIRLTTSEKKGIDPFYKQFKKDYDSNGPARKHLESLYASFNKKLIIMFVDQNNSFHWGPEQTYPGSGSTHNFISNECSLLIIINQTSTRSTQWQCHEKIFFYHSYRKTSTPANTILQADARCVHYNTTGNDEDSQIKIFGSPDIFRYYSKRITAEQLDNKLSSRVKSSNPSNRGNYEVKILVEDKDIKLNYKSNNTYSFIWKDPDGDERIITSFNYMKNTGTDVPGRNRLDNLASDVFNNIYSASESYEKKNSAIVIDGPRVDKATNTDWTKDYEKLCDKYKEILLDEKYKDKKKFAVFVKSREIKHEAFNTVFNS